MSKNTNKIPYQTLLTQELLLELYEYNQQTGKITHKHRPRKYFRSDRHYRSHNTRFAGKEAGSPDTHGYLKLTVMGYTLNAHRVIVKMVTGEWPVCVDHINGQKLDNRWINLRSCTYSDNNRNQRLQHRNKSGYPGVYWQRRINKQGVDRGYWRAQAVVRTTDGKLSKKNLGNFKDKNAAISVKKEWDRANGYHRNHGRKI